MGSADGDLLDFIVRMLSVQTFLTPVRVMASMLVQTTAEDTRQYNLGGCVPVRVTAYHSAGVCPCRQILREIRLIAIVQVRPRLIKNNVVQLYKEKGTNDLTEWIRH